MGNRRENKAGLSGKIKTDQPIFAGYLLTIRLFTASYILGVCAACAPPTSFVEVCFITIKEMVDKARG